MARPYLSDFEEERETVWLRAIECGATTTLEIALATGLSPRRVRQRIASARIRDVTVVDPDPGDRIDSGLPYVELTEEPRTRLHYRLDDDDLSRLPGCPFYIGTGRGRGLQVAHRDDVKGERPKERKPPPKFKPKRPSKKKDLPG